MSICNFYNPRDATRLLSFNAGISKRAVSGICAQIKKKYIYFSPYNRSCVKVEKKNFKYVNSIIYLNLYWPNLSVFFSSSLALSH